MVTQEDLDRMVREHGRWLATAYAKDGPDGERLSLEYASVVGLKLDGANLECARFVQTDMSGVSAVGANLRGAVLESSDLSGADLSDADLKGAGMNGADLRDAILAGANLESADMSMTFLRNADLSNANLSGVNLCGADLSVDDASSSVLDALAAVFAARMALKKTKAQWDTHRKIKEIEKKDYGHRK